MAERVNCFWTFKRHNVEEGAQFVDISHSTLRRVFRQWEGTQPTANQHNCGRKKTLIHPDRLRSSRQMVTNLFETRQQLLVNMNTWPHIPIFERTFRRELHNMHIWSTVP